MRLNNELKKKGQPKLMGARTFVSVIVGLWFSALYLRDLHGDRIARAKVDTKLPLSSEDTDDVSDDTW